MVAAGDEVPITKYATQLVENLAGAPARPADFAAAYAANVVSKEDNVGAVRTKIELGEGDGAIVYVTDAAASDKVVVIDVPDDVNVPATLRRRRRQGVGARRSRARVPRLVRRPDGQAILAGSGSCRRRHDRGTGARLLAGG